MSSDELSLFSYEILGLVGRDGAGAHDLLRMARRGRILDWAGESQYYTEPKRLAGLGYLEAHSEPGRTRAADRLHPDRARPRAPSGRTPRPRSQLTPLKSEPLLRLLLADLVGESTTRQSMLTLREDIADVLDRLEETEASAAALPHRSKYLLMVTAFLRRYVDLHVDLVDEVERELVAEEPPPGRGLSRPGDRPGR